ncbi:hypothetical protein [Streptomyces sp. KL116D]|uniref:hypothetical protein n=1 Tax=Streptomyces sp. KL116D TaxID=3045152 RepID=UPI003557454B
MPLLTRWVGFGRNGSALVSFRHRGQPGGLVRRTEHDLRQQRLVAQSAALSYRAACVVAGLAITVLVIFGSRIWRSQRKIVTPSSRWSLWSVDRRAWA